VGTMYFKCPVCGNDIHFKDAKNVFPVNYKLKCSFCASIFGFVPKVFVKADFTLHGTKIEESEIESILEADDDLDKDNIPEDIGMLDDDVLASLAPETIISDDDNK